MWRMSEPNQVVSQKMKVANPQQQVLSYQRHLQSLKKIKPGIKISQPWKPSFSLSKRLNKYHKQNEVLRQNQHLLTRMLKIQTEPMRNTINFIPCTIPSNKQTFLELKARQRRADTNCIQKQNMKIIGKIENVNSQYNRRTLSTQWKENLKHREILIKKESVPDYFQLVKQYEKMERSRIIRPKTAFSPINQNEE